MAGEKGATENGKDYIEQKEENGHEHFGES